LREQMSAVAASLATSVKCATRPLRWSAPKMVPSRWYSANELHSLIVIDVYDSMPSMTWPLPSSE